MKINEFLDEVMSTKDEALQFETGRMSAQVEVSVYENDVKVTIEGMFLRAEDLRETAKLFKRLAKRLEARAANEALKPHPAWPFPT